MTQFILNNEKIKTNLSASMTLLDFIRYHQHLTGTKIGCREGDCGACSILVGSIKDGYLNYQSATSCLMPLGNAQGKHIVTIEGINLSKLTFVQESFSNNGATQCGFCTPGFIMSLTGYCLDNKKPVKEKAIDAINGNICRCTGYKSIEKAAYEVNEKLESRKNEEAISFAVKNKIVPEYFLTIADRLMHIPSANQLISVNKKVGGGTDLYVQQHDTISSETIDFLLHQDHLKGIEQVDNYCELGGAVTVSEMADSQIFNHHFKDFQKYIKLVSSTPIRNMATIAGNFTNASPIGDFTIFFLALDAQLILSEGENKRTLALRDFYKGYKQLDKDSNEIIEKIRFELPEQNDYFNFEKVCKRTHLDIASVNTALHLKINEGVIERASLSAGGLGPVPLYLKKSSEFLIGNKVSSSLVTDLIGIAQTEISPIADARGSVAYKRLLLTQLIKAHFISFFKELDIS